MEALESQGWSVGKVAGKVVDRLRGSWLVGKGVEVGDSRFLDVSIPKTI